MSEVTMLNPARIKSDDNVRFSLKPHRIERLKDEILRDGQVNDAIEVTPIEGEKAYDYLLTVGHYRLAAVILANKEGAGLEIPGRVVEHADAASRIRRQISENRERENMSPMDEAIAIQKLTEQGVPKPEIRRIMGGMVGKSGTKTKFKEASNSFINIRMNFLDLPKKVQELLHDGRLGTNAAMDLLKHDKAKHEEIIAKAIAANDAEIARDEAAEVKLLNEEKGLTEKSQAAEVKAKEAETVAATVAEATKTVEAKVEATTAAFKAMNTAGLKPEERKAADKAFKSVEAELKQARATLEDLKKKEVKAQDGATKAQAAAATAKAKIEDARRVKAQKKADKGGKDPKKIGQKDIKKAADAAGSTAKTSAVKLNAGDIREFLHTFCLPGTPMVVAKCFKVVEEVCNGNLTSGQGVKAVIKHFENLGLNMKEKVGMADSK